MEDGTLIAYQGKLAQYRGTCELWDRPVKRTIIVVSDLPATDSIPSALIGTVPIGGWSGYVILPNGNPIYVDTSEWCQVVEDTPIRKPRDGRDYTWEWRNGKWHRVYHPRCRQCDEYHSPDLTYCEQCGFCHNPKKRCKVSK